MARCLHYNRKNHYPVFRKDFGYLVKSGGKGAWASLKTRQANSLIFLAPTAEVRLSGKLATDFWRSWTFNWAQLRQHNHVLRIATVGIRHDSPKSLKMRRDLWCHRLRGSNMKPGSWLCRSERGRKSSEGLSELEARAARRSLRNSSSFGRLHAVMASESRRHVVVRGSKH